MSETSAGPGWWQASDHKWYPPEGHPDYVPRASSAAAQTLTGEPTPVRKPAAPPLAGAPTPPQTIVLSIPSANLASVKATVSNLSVTAWLLFAGLGVAGLGVFFPWQSVSVSDGLGDVGTESSALAGSGRFLILVIVTAAVSLSWPVKSASTMSVRRTLGLTVVVGVLAILDVIAFAGVSHNNSLNGASGISYSPGFGLLVYTAAVVAVIVGVVRVWMHGRHLKQL